MEPPWTGSLGTSKGPYFGICYSSAWGPLVAISWKQNFFCLKSSVENCPRNRKSTMICPSSGRFSKPADFPKPQRPFLRPLEVADWFVHMPNHSTVGKKVVCFFEMTILTIRRPRYHHLASLGDENSIILLSDTVLK